MKRLILSFFILCIFCGVSYAGQKHTFIIHIGKTTFEYKKRVHEFDSSTPEVLQVHPKKIHVTKIHGKELLVMEVDPKKSDVRGIFYILGHDEAFEAFDYVYDVSGDSLHDLILYDLDNNSVDDVITLWGDEETYRIRVDKILKKNTHITRMNIYNSTRLGNPRSISYERKLCLYDDSLFFLYLYYDGSAHKKAMLTNNPVDPTGELYLKPIGITTEKEWKRMEKK